MTAFGYTPEPSERDQQEIEELRKKRARGETLAPDEAARLDVHNVIAREDHAMPPRLRIPPEAGKSE